jgi:insulysin
MLILLSDNHLQHGGRSNAFTDSECTNFHFDVNADYFEEALDR